MSTSARRREELTGVFREARGCTRCPDLARTRRQVVFGAGNADADLMFVGEAPGAKEDEQGIPFVGAAGKLLDELLGEVGLARKDVFIANVLKCLSHDAAVQLGDGTWDRIGRLVRSRYGGTVMSVDGAGSLVPSKVVGWHASPLGGRSVHRLTSRPATRADRDTASIQLTGDHPVLTERGWVRVDALLRDDRVATGQELTKLAFVPAGMSHSVDPDVGSEIRLEPALERSGVAYDEVEVEDVTHRYEADATFFCIDVERTHNFVTAAGVVHNCRPPGNRDPLPAEIDNCQDYLMRQVELIQPRVICTLGNFATKLLRGEPVGISRLHGQAEIITIGMRAVRLYPLFHPAAALYTRSLLDTLRADVARLPALLAMDPPAQPKPVAGSAPEAPIPQPDVAEEPDRPPSWDEPADDLPEDRQLGLF